jgi:hypothetical protein
VFENTALLTTFIELLKVAFPVTLNVPVTAAVFRVAVPVEITLVEFISNINPEAHLSVVDPILNVLFVEGTRSPAITPLYARLPTTIRSPPTLKLLATFAVLTTNKLPTFARFATATVLLNMAGPVIVTTLLNVALPVTVSLLASVVSPTIVVLVVFASRLTDVLLPVSVMALNVLLALNTVLPRIETLSETTFTVAEFTESVVPPIDTVLDGVMDTEFVCKVICDVLVFEVIITRFDVLCLNAVFDRTNSDPLAPGEPPTRPLLAYSTSEPK